MSKPLTENQIDITPLGVEPVLVTPAKPGGRIGWTKVPDEAQQGFEQDEHIDSVCLVVYDGRTREHRVHRRERDGKWYVTGIYREQPACADTPEGAQAIIEDHYTRLANLAAWDEYRATHAPPGD